MNFIILLNKEVSTKQAKHVFKSSKESNSDSFYTVGKIYKNTTTQATKLDFKEGLQLAYRYVLNDMPMGKRIDTQIKYKTASDIEKLELIKDNIRMNNLYNNLIKEEVQ